MRLIQKLLIANRGEIARRINRTARNMGIHTVALWMEGDNDLQYIKEADEAVFLDGDALSDTFLNIERILALAREWGCDAIHPGYGFLSESPEFARRCIEAGLVWIGPSPETMVLLSNKVEATRIATSLGIPTIPTLTGEVGDLILQCKAMPFPLLIKAASGGGGRGMKIVRSNEELERQLETAAFEAQSYFGNAQLFVTPYFEQVRHVEVQIVADKWGNVVHLFDRECSIQRRYQKIVEEAPCVSVHPSVREKILSDAVKLAQKAGYDNVGTVEFIVLPSGEYYFLEVNTRIQVEHPVTELVTGIDIVEYQIRSAQGVKLPWQQDDIQLQGHAIECRICAEDPVNGFLPSGGEIQLFHMPQQSYIRLEADVKNGQEINPNFDSLLAKIVVKATDRTQALQRMSETLDQTIILGALTNLPLLRVLFKYPDFQQNAIYTTFLEKHLLQLLSALKQDFTLDDTFTAVLTTCAFVHNEFLITNPSSSLAQYLGRWRLFPNLNISVHNKELSILYQYDFHRKILKMNSKEGSYEAHFSQSVNPHFFRIDIVDGRRASDLKSFEVYYAIDPSGRIFLETEGKRAEATILYRFLNTKEHRWFKPDVPIPTNPDTNRIVAPIPGKVSKIFIAEGQKIQQGDVLAIIESMKTENKLTAFSDGTIEKIFIQPGETVKVNQIMFIVSTN
ncbi:MAG: acetyl/propionyl/methylcrotonyl-CoA carboxylase subunit alpha [Bacteroidales bacterium]